MTNSPDSKPIAAPLLHMDALPAGTHLAEFELQGLLGVGGFGMVYRAYDHSLQRTVAIKEYMPSALASRRPDSLLTTRTIGDEDTYRAGLNSFVTEARLLAQFDHPSLVKVYRFWEANNTAYMAMPLYRGLTLKQARSQMTGPPPEAWLRTVLWSVLQGLQVLHDGNTMHRDVSPDNIFLQDLGPPVLLDLGAARRAITDKSHKHTAILKVNYAPIEQFAQDADLQQGAWTDLYSLGAVVYGCICNEPPTPATTRVVRDRMPSMASVRDTVKTHLGQDYSDAFVKAIDHALAIHPSDRPQNVAGFIADMQLHAVENLARFDWRGELGSELLPGLGSCASGQGQTHQRTLTQLNQLSTVQPDYEVTQLVTAPPATVDIAPTEEFVADANTPARTPAAKAEPSSGSNSATPTTAQITPRAQPPQALLQAAEAADQSKPNAPKRAGVWMAGAAALLVAVAGVWGLSAKSPPAAQAGASAASPAASSAGGADSGGKPASVGGLVAQAQATASAPAVSVAAAASAPKPISAASAPKKAKIAPTVVAPVKEAPVVYQPEDKAPVVSDHKEVSAPPPPPPAPTPKPVAAPPQELCADSNFFTRSMCIHLECKKPEFAKRAVCIENRLRYPNE